MHVDHSPAWSNAVKAIGDSQERALNAAQRIAEDGIRAVPEAHVDLMSAKMQLKANVSVVQTLDRNVGTLLDMAA